MELEKKLLEEIHNLKEELQDLKSKYELGLYTKEEYKEKKEEKEIELHKLKEKLHLLKKSKKKILKKEDKLESDLLEKYEFNIQEEMELLLKKYQVEVEQSIVTIFLPISKNKTEKIYLSLKDKKRPILKLGKDLLYLGEPTEYLETLKLWRLGQPVHIVEIINEFEKYLLNLLGIDKKLELEIEEERMFVLERARMFLNKKEYNKASYLYDYVADLSSKMGEDGVANAYRQKVHKLQLLKKGEIEL